MKTLFKVLLVLAVLLAASGVGGYFYARQAFAPPANQLTVSGLPATSTFVWQGDSMVTPARPHAVLLVPVQLAGCRRTCYLQFDTGAPYTVFYANPLAALRAAYPATQNALLPQHDTLRAVRFGLGNAQVSVAKAPVLRYGATTLPTDSTAPFVIGSLGADVLVNQALVIDFPRQRFSLYSQLPDSLTQRAQFTKLSFDNRRVLVQATVENDQQNYLFDSGSSAFSLLTSQAKWEKLATPAATPTVSGVNSWGKTLNAHTVASAAALHIGTQALPLHSVTYIDNVSFWQRALMQVSGMGGMLGNEAFTQHTVLLDAQGGRFGIVQP
ncbi:hypothetical protein ACFPAF_06225 [Hymenobacter endophyticus]|uniref:Peptidase A2 domain-containing protein n=1 Tax=Hymenobacter endophyticus TaxID=3076335 RepID=A0ABU3TF63_9BACT|nr:hypothetical protein [Hymenobacter endophyticus]MDU0369980.1 hypothetical protein [Hymenobacter endophyticus]